MNIQFLKGVGEKRAKALEKLGIRTLRELLCHYPRDYEDRSVIVPIQNTAAGDTCCICGLVAAAPRLSRIRGGLELVQFRVVDDSGALDITYFNQSYMKNQFQPGQTYSFYGRIGMSGSRRTMANPQYEPANPDGSPAGGIVPVYALTAGISRKNMCSYMRQTLDMCGETFPSALPESVRTRYRLCQSRFAFENIHFPSSFEALKLARNRLIFEELFVLACAMSRLHAMHDIRPGVPVSDDALPEFYNLLPFTLTGAQCRAIAEAAADMKSGLAMNRLVQGDVGSGKTMVAAACIWLCWHSDGQAAFMAPTEVLANQHFETFSTLFNGTGLRVIKLTGSMRASEKRAALAQIASGEADLVVGTHALITPELIYKNLVLAVTDEQHRFGVGQRSLLPQKGRTPHVLVMSATPIPRTLALIIYGDLDVSILDEMPPGRQKIDTFALGEDMRPRINRFIQRLVAEGRQVFVVCPMIEENEDLPSGLKSAEEHAAALRRIFPDLRVYLVHGRMKPAEKDRIMAEFSAGQADILVSTTVIEVGVDVPNAALMIVENAERFGLSQLHQLRGRVGRGKHKSYCVLFSDSKSPETRARLKIMCETNDGFKISEEDLRLRGPGDFFGSRQHGLPEMHIANLCADMNLLKLAQKAAAALLQEDPSLSLPENQALSQRVNQLFELNLDTIN